MNTYIPSVFAALAVLSASPIAASAQDADYRTITVSNTQLARLGLHGPARDKDCALRKPPVVSVVDAPSSGELQIRSAKIKLPATASCPEIEAPVQAVLFRAKPKFTGQDKVSYTVTGESGRKVTHIIQIVVKTGGPSSTRPSRERETAI